MSIFRKRAKQYTVIPQAVIRDERLSLKDIGLLLRLLSFPDNWEFTELGLISVFQHDGRSSVRSSLKRLEEYGYLIRKRVRGGHGHLANCEWTIFDSPNCDSPMFEKPTLDKPTLENRTQSNTNISNTKVSNTKEIDIYPEVIKYLNQKTGKNYKVSCTATRRLISARIAEGHTLDDFKRVIDNKTAQWKNDSKMAQFLRPETLFSSSHFDSYLNETPVQEQSKHGFAERSVTEEDFSGFYVDVMNRPRGGKSK